MTTQAKNYKTRSDLEAKTHELLDFDRPESRVKWSPKAAVVAMVFRAQYHASLTVEQVERVGEALAGYAKDGCAPGWLQETLTEMTRAKVLRSQMASGKRHYEVNY